MTSFDRCRSCDTWPCSCRKENDSCGICGSASCRCDDPPDGHTQATMTRGQSLAVGIALAVLVLLVVGSLLVIFTR
jgi:hypothetical protein